MKKLSAIGFQLSAWIADILDDLLYLAGAGLIIYATWMLSVVAALYTAGGFCLIGAVLIGFSRRGK